ncbi:MAG: lactonase family protein [Parafilimonas terrae]|nr:lactonase family protein [Parafilimonas terrae]
MDLIDLRLAEASQPPASTLLQSPAYSERFRTKLHRRAVLGGLLVAADSLGSAQAAGPRTQDQPLSGAALPVFAYVGCRTTKERNARGEGIRVFKVDPASGAWTPVQLLSGLVNPSFLAFDRGYRHLYAVHGDMSEVSAFRIDPGSGELTLLNTQSTRGRNPVHLVTDPSDRFLIVANYATGTLAVLPRRADGGLDPVVHTLALPGTPGPNRFEQTSSHPHEVAFDRANRFLIVPDKGLDRVFSLRFDADDGAFVGEPTLVQVRPGAGPRHAVQHPSAPFFYVAHELDSSVGAYRYDVGTGTLTPFQILPSIPDTVTGANTAAEIAITPSGRFVYVSDRGGDGIRGFAVDGADGRLTPIGWTLSGGKGPRFFAIAPGGRHLYAANETSDTIIPFVIDAETGRLDRAGDPIETGSPVCIVFSPSAMPDGNVARP